MGTRPSRMHTPLLSTKKDSVGFPSEELYAVPEKRCKRNKPPRPRLVDECDIGKMYQSSFRDILTKSKRVKTNRFGFNRPPTLSPNKKVEEWLKNSEDAIPEISLLNPSVVLSSPIICNTSSGCLSAQESVILELLQRVRAEVQTIRETSSMTKKEELLEGMEEAILYDICYVERRMEERRSQRRSMRQPRAAAVPA